jgi:CubicO group peptidase (beta-lactamase class C family)
MVSTQLTPAALDRLHSAMAAHVERGEFPGLVTLVATRDQAHVDLIGKTAFENGQPMQRETVFRVASLTKPVVAAATLMLVDDGRLSLGDSVDRWLPELANRRVLKRIDGPLDETVPAKRPLTVDDLLTNRLGYGVLTEPTFNPPFPIVNASKDLELALFEPDPRTPHAADEWMKRFGSLPLMYQPGERWLYNVGFLILGVLVARVADQPLGDFLREHVFDPLGMRSTGFWLPAERTRGLPSYYMTNFETGKLEPRRQSPPDEWSRPPAFPSGAGGLLSTVDDFLSFGRMLLNGGEADGKRLFSDRLVAAMTTNYLTPEQIAGAGVVLNGNGWGYGVSVVTKPDADWPVPGRYGWSGGYGTSWFNDPHRGLIAIALTQVSDFLWNGAQAEFAKLVGTV